MITLRKRRIIPLLFELQMLREAVSASSEVGRRHINSLTITTTGATSSQQKEAVLDGAYIYFNVTAATQCVSQTEALFSWHLAHHA